MKRRLYLMPQVLDFCMSFCLRVRTYPVYCLGFATWYLYCLVYYLDVPAISWRFSIWERWTLSSLSCGENFLSFLTHVFHCLRTVVPPLDPFFHCHAISRAPAQQQTQSEGFMRYQCRSTVLYPHIISEEKKLEDSTYFLCPRCSRALWVRKLSDHIRLVIL